MSIKKLWSWVSGKKEEPKVEPVPQWAPVAEVPVPEKKKGRKKSKKAE